MPLPQSTLWRRFGGAQPQRTPRGKHFKANAPAQKRTKATPSAPFPASPVTPSPATPSRSPARNAQTRSKPTKAYNRTGTTRTHEQRSRPGGIGTQAIASRPVCRHAANSRREPMAKRRDRNASPNAREGRAAREAHSLTRPAPEESPERPQCGFHFWLFGAVWGAQPQRTPRGKHFKANAPAQKRTKATPPAPFPASPVTPSRSPQINAQTRSEPTKADNRANAARTHEQRSRPGGIGTQAIASRPVCRHAANSRREARTNAVIEPRGQTQTERQSRRQKAHRLADQLHLPATPDNRANAARTHERRSRPGGTGTEHIASRPVCRNAANSRREPRQSAATETHRRTRAKGKPTRQKRIAKRAHPPRPNSAFPSPSPNSAFHISHFPSPFLRAPHHRNRRASAHPRSNITPASPTPDSIYFARASDKRAVYK